MKSNSIPIGISFYRVIALIVIFIDFGTISKAESAAKEELFQVIKESESTAAFETGLNQITNATPQQILEAKVLWAIFREGGGGYFSKVSDQLPQAILKWKREDAIMLRSPDQVEATLHYVAAMRADAQGDPNTAKNEGLSAVWLDPKQTLYTNFIVDLRTRDLKVPMNVVVRTADGSETTFEKLAKGSKAVYIQIWSTWCGPCLALFPALKDRAAKLPPQGVQVVALNSELGRDHVIGGNASKAKHLQEQRQMDLPWLIEPSSAPYTSLLDVDSVPRAIVIDTSGLVLFDGHPMDKKLTSVLKKIDVNIDLKSGLEQADD
jgi:thiol-disulfide isomerase/thioredoxin